MSRTRKLFWLALFFGVICTGCTGARSPEERKGELIYGYSDVFKTFDPVRQVYSQETAIIQQVLEPLVVFDQDLKLAPALATKWDTPDACSTWIFTLRTGVVFHDGTPFDGFAVKAHFDRLLDPKTASSRRTIYQDIESVEVPEPYTVIFHMRSPFCIFPERATAASASIPSPTAIKDPKKFAKNPVGTGPFEFVEWKPDRYIRLKKFQKYWNADNYHIEKLEFRPVQENTTRLILLEQGVIDMADVAFAHVNVAKKTSDIVVQSAPQLSIRYIGFNTQKPPMTDVRIRQAANYAINKPEMLASVFFGVGEPAQGALPPVLPDFNPDQKFYEYNPEKAKALMAEAGYDKDHPLHAELWTREAGEYRTAADAAVEYMRQVGFDVKMKVIDNAAYWDKFDEFLNRDGRSLPNKPGVFDLFLGGWVGGETSMGFLEPLFRTGSYSNNAFYSNPKVDALLDKVKQEPSQEKRWELTKQIQTIIAEDAPWIFAYHGQINVGVRKRVHNYVVNPAGLYIFEGVTLDGEGSDE